MAETFTTNALSFELDGASLGIEDVVAVARHGARASVAGRARDRIEQTLHLKRELIESGIPIYGVTTGFGDSAHRQISPAKAARLQENLIRFMGCGTGPIAPPEVVRATMLLRANCLAKGNSGIRPELIDHLLLLLNEDVVPVVPERGSCGASGDLVPLSHIASALLGEADVLYHGVPASAHDALAALGAAPFELEAKEGLALTNGTSFMSAFACLVVHDARELAAVAELLTAMTSEALLGNRGHFNSFLFGAKPHPGQIDSAYHIRQLLAGSELSCEFEPERGQASEGFHQLERQVQDRYSVRCAPHVIGALRDTLEWVARWVTIEINASDDNPLFDLAAGRVQSGGNFYGSHIAQGMDALKIALANLCDLLDRQLELVVDEKFNVGLTANLIAPANAEGPEAGLHHGFKGMQLCCSAMTAEALKLCNPASIHSRSTEAHNQDKVSMGAIAARDARAIVELARDVAAVQLIALSQALDLRGADRASPRTRAARDLVRTAVPFLECDRRMHADIRLAGELIASGELMRTVDRGQLEG